jgi:hypothetical protein
MTFRSRKRSVHLPTPMFVLLLALQAVLLALFATTFTQQTERRCAYAKRISRLIKEVRFSVA